MLVQFKVGNFTSFKSEVTLSMMATNQKEFLDTHIFTAHGNLKLLRSSAIYGANASGKSNLFTAMGFMRFFILNSSKNLRAKEHIPVDPFRLMPMMIKEPSFFEMIFIKDNVRYRYGFRATQLKVVEEWLFAVTRVRNEEMLFQRVGSEFRLNEKFIEGKGLEEKTRENALFLSVIAQFNGEISNRILEWFDDLTLLTGRSYGHEGVNFNILKSALSDQQSKKFLLNFMKKADLGIEDVSLTEDEVPMDKIPKEVVSLIKQVENIADVPFPRKQISINFHHRTFDEKSKRNGLIEFDMDDESIGTRKLFNIMPAILYCLGKGRVLIIDELDSSLHPLLSRLIIRLFHEMNNQSYAQLIFNTHDSNLLSNKIFRRDQIWFTEKDEYGVTDLYSLADYNVRNDASYGKDYLMGKYGGIPYVGSFDFFEENNNGK